MEEGAAATQDRSPDKEEQATNGANEKKDPEKRAAFEEDEGDTKEEVLKSVTSKEPSKKAPISSFFGEATCPYLCAGTSVHVEILCFIISKAPRKAALKMEKPEKLEGEKKTSAERKTSADEAKDAKW